MPLTGDEPLWPGAGRCPCAFYYDVLKFLSQFAILQIHEKMWTSLKTAETGKSCLGVCFRYLDLCVFQMTRQGQSVARRGQWEGALACSLQLSAV